MTRKDVEVVANFQEASQSFASSLFQTNTASPTAAAAGVQHLLTPVQAQPPQPPPPLQSNYPVVSKAPLEVLNSIKYQISFDLNKVSETIPMYNGSCVLGKRPVGYCDWQWPFILNRLGQATVTMNHPIDGRDYFAAIE